MASLVSLPNELKDLVFNHLLSRDLLRLAATCRALHAVALPAAYAAVSLDWHNADQTGIVPVGPDLSGLLATLVNRPDLTGLVKDLTFTAMDCMYFPGLGIVGALLPVKGMLLDKGIVRRTLETLHVPWSDTVETTISKNEGFTTAMGLIFALCTNLESLSIAVDFILEFGSYVDLIQFVKERGSTLLRKLKTWRITCSTDLYSSLSIATRGRFLLPFYIETLETIELMAFKDVLDRDSFEESEQEVRWFWPAEIVPNASNVTTLRLLRTAAIPQAAGLLLRQCPHLRVFEFHALMHPSKTPLDLSALKSALDHVRATLTQLTVCHEMSSDDNDELEEGSDVTAGTWGSFSEYAALTHLTLSAHTVFDEISEPNFAAMLPPHLQYLTITHDLHWLDVRMHFQDLPFQGTRFLAFLRAYLVGETVLKRYEGDDKERELANEKVVWLRGGVGGEWVASTPDMKEVVFDIRRVEERRAGRGVSVEGCFGEIERGGVVACEVWRRK
jgi:hypothetical protein